MKLYIIGYGDVTPDAPAEYWVVSFLMLLGGIVWAYIIGATVTIASNLNSDRDAFEEQVANLNILIRHTPGIKEDHDLKLRMRRFFYTRHLRGDAVNAVRDEVTHGMSADMKDTIIRYTFEPYLQGVRLFRASIFLDTLDAKCSIAALKLLCQDVQLRSYAYGSSFCVDDNENEDEIEDRGVYCIKSGLVAVRTEGGFRGLRVLNQFNSFGSDTVFLSEQSPLLNKRYVYAFIFSEVYFFPQKWVLRAARLCPAMWKAARWRIALLQLWKVANELRKKETLKNHHVSDIKLDIK